MLALASNGGETVHRITAENVYDSSTSDQAAAGSVFFDPSAIFET